MYALNTNTALLNINFSLSGSSPKYCSFVSVVKDESDIINSALLRRELSLLNKISLQPSQTVDAYRFGEGKYEHGKNSLRLGVSTKCLSCDNI